MHELINSIANVVKSASETVDTLGEATQGIIEVSLSGKYAQRNGETDEAYRARLEFLKNKETKKEENKIMYKMLKSQERLKRRELKHSRQEERKEAKILKRAERRERKLTENR